MVIQYGLLFITILYTSRKIIIKMSTKNRSDTDTETRYGRISKENVFCPSDSSTCSLGTLIEGLYYVPNYISDDEAQDIIQYLNKNEWIRVSNRKVQHYGYKFHYRNRHSNMLEKCEKDIPQCCQSILDRIIKDKRFNIPNNYFFDQCIVNNYPKNTGIKPHLDRINCFDQIIVAISLLSPTIMDFKHIKNKQDICAIKIEANSVMIFSSQSRYQWSHSIWEQSKQLYNGQYLRKDQRISLTFRKTKHLNQFSFKSPKMGHDLQTISIVNRLDRLINYLDNVLNHQL